MCSLRRRLRLLSLALPASAAIAVCCSSSIATAASASAAQAHASRNPLSGTWSGRYSGAYHGSFTLHWTESGSKLTGTIKLSNPKSQPNVTGTVHRTTIRFGTVGSAAITYSGSVSGKSMSGTYQTPGGGGSWSAHKTSS